MGLSESSVADTFDQHLSFFTRYFHETSEACSSVTLAPLKLNVFQLSGLGCPRVIRRGRVSATHFHKSLLSVKRLRPLIRFKRIQFQLAC